MASDRRVWIKADTKAYAYAFGPQVLHEGDGFGNSLPTVSGRTQQQVKHAKQVVVCTSIASALEIRARMAFAQTAEHLVIAMICAEVDSHASCPPHDGRQFVVKTLWSAVCIPGNTVAKPCMNDCTRHINGVTSRHIELAVARVENIHTLVQEAAELQNNVGRIPHAYLLSPDRRFRTAGAGARAPAFRFETDLSPFSEVIPVIDKAS